MYPGKLNLPLSHRLAPVLGSHVVSRTPVRRRLPRRRTAPDTPTEGDTSVDVVVLSIGPVGADDLVWSSGEDTTGEEWYGEVVREVTYGRSRLVCTHT